MQRMYCDLLTQLYVLMIDQIFVEGNVIYLVFLIIAIIAFHLKKRWLRYPIMLAALATIGFLQMGCPSPVRAMQTIVSAPGEISTGITFVAKVVIVLISALFAGKIFCGWVCPKGTIQEFLFRKSLKIEIPTRLDQILRYGKYLMLALLIALPLGLNYQLFNPETSPFAALFNLGGGMIAVLLLTLTLVASLFIYRPFCRYLCPIGALLGLVSLLNRVTFHTSEACICCHQAEQQCDIGALTASRIDTKAQITVRKSECLMCGECRQHCRKGLNICLFSAHQPSDQDPPGDS